MIHKIRAFFQFYYPRKGIIWLSQQKMEHIYVRASIYTIYTSERPGIQSKFNRMRRNEGVGSVTSHNSQFINANLR